MDAEVAMRKGSITDYDADERAGTIMPDEGGGAQITFHLDRCRFLVIEGDVSAFNGVRANREPEMADEVAFECADTNRPFFATKWAFVDDVKASA